MTFFYDLNKKLAAINDKQDTKQLAEHAVPASKSQLAEADYSAKAARAGKDIGKPGKNFEKIAKSAGKQYGSKAAGERVAGAVLNKLRHKTNETFQGTPSGTEFQVESDMDESALQAYLGKKKYGQEGMKALQQAGRDHVGKAKMDKIRSKYDQMDESDMDEGNAFTGALAKTPKGGKFKVGSKEFTDTSSLEEVGQPPMTPKQKKFAKLAPPTDKITFADKIVGAKKEVDEMLGDVAADAMRKAVSSRKPGEVDEGWDDMLKMVNDREMRTGEKRRSHTGGEYERTKTGVIHRAGKHYGGEEADDHDDEDTPKKKGSKSDDGAPKKRGRPAGSKRSIGAKGPSGKSKLMTKEGADYGQAKQIYNDLADCRAIAKQAQRGGQFPQGFASRLENVLWAAMTLIKNQQPGHAQIDEDDLEEKAVSKKQQKFMGMVHAAQKGEKPASKEVAKVAKTMKKSDAEDFASTKHKGLPEKKAKDSKPVKEEGAEPSKSKGGIKFGQGVYEGFNSKIEKMISEGMSVTVNMSQASEDGHPGNKSITVNADGDDAEALAQLLNLAGLQGKSEHACPTCNEEPCGCSEVVDENSPDWPTNSEITGDDDPLLQRWAGGLNKPKSTGQTVNAPFNRQDSRQGPLDENTDLGMNLYKELQQFKGK